MFPRELYYAFLKWCMKSHIGIPKYEMTYYQTLLHICIHSKAYKVLKRCGPPTAVFKHRDFDAPLKRANT